MLQFDNLQVLSELHLEVVDAIKVSKTVARALRWTEAMFGSREAVDHRGTGQPGAFDYYGGSSHRGKKHSLTKSTINPVHIRSATI